MGDIAEFKVNMNFYLLEPVKNLGEDNPWNPWYDKSFGFLIRAESELDARQQADNQAGDENRNAVHPWLDEKYSTCVNLNDVEETGVILQDFRSA